MVAMNSGQHACLLAQSPACCLANAVSFCQCDPDPALAGRILGRGPGSLPRKCIGYQFFDLATNQ